MKKIAFFCFLAALQVFVFTGFDKGNGSSMLFAQSSSDSQRIVGTWILAGRGVVFTFTADGKYTVSGAWVTERNGDYLLSNSRLLLRNGSYYSDVIEYYLSDDGRALVLNYFIRPPATSAGTNSYIWLIKQ